MLAENVVASAKQGLQIEAHGKSWIIMMPLNHGYFLACESGSDLPAPVMCIHGSSIGSKNEPTQGEPTEVDSTSGDGEENVEEPSGGDNE
jgi:hypothetical protein